MLVVRYIRQHFSDHPKFLMEADRATSVCITISGPLSINTIGGLAGVSLHNENKKGAKRKTINLKAQILNIQANKCLFQMPAL